MIFLIKALSVLLVVCCLSKFAMSKSKIGILLGSARSTRNCRGLEKWLLLKLSASGNDLASVFADGTATGTSLITYENIYPHAPMHPLGPVDGETIPALISTESGSYASESVNEWSKLVKSCSGFIILTPQYNWGYPGDLKNVLDHLYSEWKGKPVVIITYGGHGGDKCDTQLRQVCSGLRMNVIEEKVSITLPSEYIRTSLRLKSEDFESSIETDSKFQFLIDAEPALLRAVSALKSAVTSAVV